MAQDTLIDPTGTPEQGQPRSLLPSKTVSGIDVFNWFKEVLGRQPTPEEHAQFDGMETSAFMQALRGIQPTAQTTPAPTPDPQQGGNGGPSGPSLIDPYNQPFTPPAPVDLGGPAGIPYIPPTPHYTAPTFTPPAYTPPPAFNYKPFEGPNAETVLNTPGYKFRLNQGEEALQNAKAAQGILGTGATLKAILGYGQDYASNEFQNEWAREFAGYNTNRQGAVDAYNTNYQTQYVDPYRFSYQGALDAFAPQMAQFGANVQAGNLGYSTQAAAGQHQTDQNYLNAWNSMLFDYDKFRDQRDSTFNKQFAVLGA